MRFGLKGKHSGRWSRTASFVAVAFVLAATQGSLAKDWSCTPPGDPKTAEAIAKLTHNEFVIDGNLQNKRFVESVLKKRLNLKSDFVTCSDKYCKISDELFKLMHVGEEYRYHGVAAVCSIHADVCDYWWCDKSRTNLYHVIYRWMGGMLAFSLETIPGLSGLQSTNEMLDYDMPYDPKVRSQYIRMVGVSSNSAIYIDYMVYEDD